VGGVRESIAIDLHWSLVGHDRDRRAPGLDWFRLRAREGRLEATAHLLYLAAHLKLQHYDERAPLLWLCDFYLLSQRKEIDWDELLRAAGAFGWIEALAATASELEERLGLPSPEPLRALATVSSRAATADRKGGPRRAWNELSTLDWRGRAALARAYLLPSPSYVRWRYRPRPRWIWPIYYPVRWARLVRSGMSLLPPARRAGGARPLLRSPS
jgi:hypothetical protein